MTGVTRLASTSLRDDRLLFRSLVRMKGTKILWGQVLLVGAVVLAFVWAATEWTAWRLAFQPELGRPWFAPFGWPLSSGATTGRRRAIRFWWGRSCMSSTRRGIRRSQASPTSSPIHGVPIKSTLRAMMTAPHLGARGVHPVVASAARELLNKSDNERSGRTSHFKQERHIK